ncbi:ATP-binding protein [Nonomuraea antimicrobica]
MAMLIGRERPAAILRGEVERALVSHGALVLVTGEAGVGKSALVADAAEEAVRGGARVLTGACWEGEGAPGYWPWVQVVRQLSPGATPQDLARGDGEAFELYDAVTGLLVSASREQPVVVVLEDLHWADAASLRLLEFVVGHAWFERLLVIGTYRDAEVEGALSLPLEARATTLALTGLDRAGVGRLVARTTGVPPSDELVSEIHRRTGGNPFFVEQAARLWQGGSPLATIPPGVEAAVRRRLSRLADGVLDVLRMGAVLGREFAEEPVSTALARPVRMELDQAVSAKLVTSRGAGHYAFVHDLVRETLYADLDEPVLGTLHAAALRALDTALPATLAHHAYLAAVPEAPDLLLAAARDAEGRMADEEAVTHYRRALELTSSADRRRRATIGFDLGVAQHRAGDTAAGVRTVEAAIAITRGLDAPDLLAIAALKLHDLCYAGQDRWTDFVHEAHQRLVHAGASPHDPPPHLSAPLASATGARPDAQRTGVSMGVGPGAGPGAGADMIGGARAELLLEIRRQASARGDGGGGWMRRRAS